MAESTPNQSEQRRGRRTGGGASRRGPGPRLVSTSTIGRRVAVQSVRRDGSDDGRNGSAASIAYSAMSVCRAARGAVVRRSAPPSAQATGRLTSRPFRTAIASSYRADLPWARQRSGAGGSHSRVRSRSTASAARSTSKRRRATITASVSMGVFYRSIPLPEGVITDSAQALFRNSVLEITMQALPAEVTRGRRLEIKEGSEGGNQT